MEADSTENVDRMITSLPISTTAETHVTPRIALDERRKHLKELLERLAALPA